MRTCHCPGPDCWGDGRDGVEPNECPPECQCADITTDEAGLPNTRMKSGLLRAYEAAIIHVPAGRANGVPKEA